MSYFRQTANYQVSISDSSVSTQSIQSASTINVTNSRIDYTPHKDAKYVVYEGSLYLTNSLSAYCIFSLWHYTGGSWSEISSDNRRQHYTMQYGNSDSNTNELNCYFKFKLDSWQGQRPVRLRLNNYSQYWNARMHRTIKWEGTGTDAYIMPQFMMYSVL